MSITYKNAGVDKNEGYKAVELMKENVKKTHNKNVLANLGSFGAMYELGKYKNPILVSGTDGVGTKLEIALKQKKYDTVGIDCVAMCANDILCHGAKPLFFLDYLACGKLDSTVASEIVSGIANGCMESDQALVGGETAEMPGFYKLGDYDIAGFCVGVVEKDKLLDGSKVNEGDVIIALSSSGVHSNGFSLVRKVFTDYNEIIDGKKISDTLLTPTRIYVKSILSLLEKFEVKSMAHITGGGLIENLPRAMKEDLRPVVYKDKIKVLDIFKLIQKRADISEDEMYGTFNMGVGFCIIVDKNIENDVISYLNSLGENAYTIGYIEKGEHSLCLV
ncbi:phosphoribosylformylglycinamidine cyclo-ligase [Oceanivirga miroungae]|uniref:Phosphoribosylformylglycinamidine cyclo-ligase n=1 Tax=Oceanivirga miroungae TaxID=1130046 RepID=A0A6I8M7Q5_9FUSO|nr:phosphoribosylformylglycinamidine cyclo-ligase [Oceanivirga miroungae]VWL85520.1 phosphoribosylformylglycinamidine cyclo-ligase [Oceanivirga miroungae]